MSGPFVPGEPGRPPAGVRTVGARAAEATGLVLIRHGEAACNVAGVIGGPLGCTGLTASGVSQVRALHARLERTGEFRDVTALYSSVLQRAEETAGIIGPATGVGLEAISDCELCELHPGDADGLTWEAFGAKYGDPDWDRDPEVALAPGGETWTGFVDRAAAGLEAVARRHHGQRVVVVCHAGVIEASLLRFMPVAPSQHRLKLRTAHASITEWEHAEGGWHLLRYNDAAHTVAAAPAAAGYAAQ